MLTHQLDELWAQPSQKPVRGLPNHLTFQGLGALRIAKPVSSRASVRRPFVPETGSRLPRLSLSLESLPIPAPMLDMSSAEPQPLLEATRPVAPHSP